MEKFIKGDHVRTSAQGRRTYTVDPHDIRKNIDGRVISVIANIVKVRYGDEPYDVASMYDNCVEHFVPEVTTAPTKTPRRGQ